MVKRGDGIYKRGNTWWLDFKHEGKRHYERLGKFISKTAAREIAQVKQSQILKGEAGIKRKRLSITFDEAKKLYLEWADVNRRPRSVVFLKEALQRLGETFSGRRLDQITRFSVEGYKSQRAKKAPVRANREIAVLKSMFNRCIEWRKFDGLNPVVGVKLLPEPKRRLRFLDHDDEERLLAHAWRSSLSRTL
jgi:integrase